MSKPYPNEPDPPPINAEGSVRQVNRMLVALGAFKTAQSASDVVKVTASFLEEDVRDVPVPLEELGILRVESVEDIDSCIARLQEAMHDSPLMGHDEDRVDRLLSFLLVASVRARQLS